MRLLNDGQSDCGHPNIDNLGNDHDARFFRCGACGQVFIVQGGLTLTVPGVPAQRHTALERAPSADAELPRVGGGFASE